jgi:NADP-dependent 3-hydroxy acid dehydrogenase YdfG
MEQKPLVMITGASAGIGAACARVFAREGYRLLLLARRLERLEALASELREKYGSEVLVRMLDVRQAARVREVLELLPAQWRNIDLLINNAGLSRGLDKLHEGNLEHWETMIDTNIKGLLYVSRQVIPGMVARGRGHVINVGSIAGHQVYPGGNVYCATKHAVKALTQGMQIDLLGTPVRVSSLDPGLVDTEFARVRFDGDEEKAAAVYQGMEPLHAEDVAEIALFIATRPPHVNISNLIVLPSQQATAMLVDRSGRQS